MGIFNYDNLAAKICASRKEIRIVEKGIKSGKKKKGTMDSLYREIFRKERRKRKEALKIEAARYQIIENLSKGNY